MIERLARFSIGNPVAVHLGTLALVVSGFWFFFTMPREVFPSFSLKTVTVTSVYPAAAPEDVERLVTLPIEDELEGLDGLKEMTSRSQEGLSTITLVLHEDADVSEFLDDVRARLARDLELPPEVEDPSVREIESEFPVIAVFVYGNVSELDLRREAEKHERELEKIPGVSQVILGGVREPRIWVEVDPVALERFDLTLEEVGRAVGARARDAPVGSLSTASGDFLLRVESGVDAADALRELPIRAEPDGPVLRLSQVARVVDTFERPTTRVHYQGQPSLHLQVNKHAQADMISVADAVHAYVEEARARAPAGVTLGTNSDLSIYVENRLRVMRNSALLGGLLVLVSLVLFLDVRVALMTAVGIPISFLGGILIAASLGITMNMMTMFALIVVLGMIVDDAIVVGENVFRKIEEGVPPVRAAIQGTAEVGKPVTATILTTIAAFLPILLVGGVIGQFMRPLPLLVAFCLIASLAEALVVLPCHLAHWSRGSPARGAGSEGRWYAPMRRAYLRFLAFALRWRYVGLAAASAVALLLGAYAVHRIPFVLFDDFESKVFYVNLRASPGSSLDETERLARPAQEIAMDLPDEEFESANFLVGISFADATRWEQAQNLAQVWVELREGTEGRRPTSAIIEHLRDRLDPPPPGIESVEIAQPQGGPTGKPIDVAVRGPDLAVLRGIAADVRAELETYRGVRDVIDTGELGKREVRFRLKDEGRTLGFTEASLAAEMRAAFEGTRWAEVRRGNDAVEIVVKLPEEAREERGILERLRVPAPDGTHVPLSLVAELEEGRGPAVITRDDGQRSIRVLADVHKREGNAQEIRADLMERFADLPQRLPGYSVGLKGEHKDLEEAFAGFYDSLVVAVLLIYLILGSLFRSFTQPFVIMFAIPFGTIGMILGHVAMDRNVSFMSLIGLLALSGIVVNDSLILVDFVNERRRGGEPLLDALVGACRVRFRPILLTSITTMLGLSPLTFFASGQARFLQPMAISLFFGIATATLLILLVVPCAYAVLEDLIVLGRRPLDTIARLRGDVAVHPREGATSSTGTEP